jgi:large subunit ribosomal protein L21
MKIAIASAKSSSQTAKISGKLADPRAPRPRFGAMSYAIISLGGKQYRVQEGERLLVDRVPTEEGKTFHPEVLMIGGDGNVDLAPKVQVTAKVVGSQLGQKIRIGKYKPKTGYRRHTGFRAKLSQIEIQSIGGAKRAAAEKTEPAAKKEPEAAPAKLPRGYADMTVADINEKVGNWSAEQVDAALEYERAHAKRKGALAALEARKDS